MTHNIAVTGKPFGFVCPETGPDTASAVVIPDAPSEGADGAVPSFCGLDMLGMPVFINDTVVGCSTGNALCVYYVDTSEIHAFGLVPIIRRRHASATDTAIWERVPGKAIITRAMSKLIKLQLGSVRVHM